MNADDARRLIAALPTDRPATPAERDEILGRLTPNDEVHASAYRWRLYWQNIRGRDRAEAIREAITSHRRFVAPDEVDGLRKAVRHPNGRVRMLAKEKRDSEVALRNIFDEADPTLKPSTLKESHK